VDALDRESLDTAVAAMDLDRVGGDPLAHLGGEELGHRRFLEAGLAGVAASSTRPPAASEPVAMSARRKATGWC
jgi:hypothetical protein